MISNIDYTPEFAKTLNDVVKSDGRLTATKTHNLRLYQIFVFGTDRVAKSMEEQYKLADNTME